MSAFIWEKTEEGGKNSIQRCGKHLKTLIDVSYLSSASVISLVFDQCLVTSGLKKKNQNFELYKWDDLSLERKKSVGDGTQGQGTEGCRTLFLEGEMGSPNIQAN